MKKFLSALILFFIGAVGYAVIELIWRGHTHWSMMLAGGFSILIFAFIETRCYGIHRLYRCILGSFSVTIIELLFGLFFNIYLDFSVWDYSNIPFNFLGQICLLYSVLWGFLCFPCMPLAKKIYGGLYEIFLKKNLGRD